VKAREYLRIIPVILNGIAAGDGDSAASLLDFVRSDWLPAKVAAAMSVVEGHEVGGPGLRRSTRNAAILLREERAGRVERGSLSLNHTFRGDRWYL